MPALAHGLLPQVLSRLRESFPNLTTVVEEQPRARIEDQVGSGYFDLGLVTLPVQDDRLDLTPLGNVHAVCVMPPDHRLAAKPEISVDDLEDESVISVAPETLLRHRTDALFGEARVRRHLAFQTQSTLLACQFSRNGLGVAIVHPLIAMSLGPLIVHRPFKPRIDLQYAIATARDNKSEVVRKFVTLAKVEMDALVEELTSRS
jgi:DNA-binding transcriptional LysR family regulator